MAKIYLKKVKEDSCEERCYFLSERERCTCPDSMMNNSDNCIDGGFIFKFVKRED